MRSLGFLRHSDVFSSRCQILFPWGKWSPLVQLVQTKKQNRILSFISNNPNCLANVRLPQSSSKTCSVGATGTVIYLLLLRMYTVLQASVFFLVAHDIFLQQQCISVENLNVQCVYCLDASEINC
jgi:hypothetical protein